MRTSHLVIWTQSDVFLQSATLRRNIADLEKKYSELEKKYFFSMEMYESMMKRVTNAEISVGLLRSRFEAHCQGGPRRSPEIQSMLVWSSCWGATGSARRSTQRGE